MKILHTSDWHLGRALYGRKRYKEFEQFLAWLFDTITRECIDVLLVAGDIFDTTTPSNRAQHLYYQFLSRVSDSCCNHIVIIGGNHDSPSFLNAPGELLKALQVHIVGSVADSLDYELIELKDVNDKTTALVCAVPYLRDKDIRTVRAGESTQEKAQNLVIGLTEHYDSVISRAEKRRTELQRDITDHLPVIVMGHLFATGGKTFDGDGVRELYVGSLAHVGSEIFPDTVDYVGLGHLHIPQSVGRRDHIRYSGSPLPIGFGEANHKKKIVIVEFSGSKREIAELTVPTFQRLVQVRGTLKQIIEHIQQLVDEAESIWLEIEFTGLEIVPDLRTVLEGEVENSQLEILRIKNQPVINRVLESTAQEETLDDLDVEQVFERCLESHDITEEEKPDLIASYKEIIRMIDEEQPDGE